jgi:hypothetical protein
MQKDARVRKGKKRFQSRETEERMQYTRDKIESLNSLMDQANSSQRGQTKLQALISRKGKCLPKSASRTGFRGDERTKQSPRTTRALAVKLPHGGL